MITRFIEESLFKLPAAPGFSLKSETDNQKRRIMKRDSPKKYLSNHVENYFIGYPTLPDSLIATQKSRLITVQYNCML